MTAFDIFVKVFLNEQLPLDNFMGKILAFHRVDLPLSLIFYVRVNANFTYDF